jgi:uncharacterized repeat protein (TIGR03803 family)
LVAVSTAGRLYGTTYGGGAGPSPGPCAQGCGTIYSIDPNNPASYQIVHKFQGAPDDGAVPEGDLTIVKVPSGNTIYGTTSYGGTMNASTCPHGCGTVFKIAPSGQYSILYNFQGGTADGADPVGTVRVINNTVYGMTQYGGTQDFGTIFELTPSGDRVLHSFEGALHDGAYPTDNLLQIGTATSVLYGVTSQGGKSNVGTVFEVPLAPSPSATEAPIHSFNASEGDYPVGLDINKNTIYGTTSADGPNARGTVYSMTTSGHITVIYSFRGKPDGALPYDRPRFYKDELYGTTNGGRVRHRYHL